MRCAGGRSRFVPYPSPLQARQVGHSCCLGSRVWHCILVSGGLSHLPHAVACAGGLPAVAVYSSHATVCVPGETDRCLGSCFLAQVEPHPDVRPCRRPWAACAVGLEHGYDWLRRSFDASVRAQAASHRSTWACCCAVQKSSQRAGARCLGAGDAKPVGEVCIDGYAVVQELMERVWCHMLLWPFNAHAKKAALSNRYQSKGCVGHTMLHSSTAFRPLFRHTLGVHFSGQVVTRRAPRTSTPR